MLPKVNKKDQDVTRTKYFKNESAKYRKSNTQVNELEKENTEKTAEDLYCTNTSCKRKDISLQISGPLNSLHDP